MQPESSKNKPVAVLAGFVIALMLIWGVVLPSIATWPHFQKSQQIFEASGVNPTAFFYTDHPRMLDRSFHENSVNNKIRVILSQKRIAKKPTTGGSETGE